MQVCSNIDSVILNKTDNTLETRWLAYDVANIYMYGHFLCARPNKGFYCQQKTKIFMSISTQS